MPPDDDGPQSPAANTAATFTPPAADNGPSDDDIINELLRDNPPQRGERDEPEERPAPKDEPAPEDDDVPDDDVEAGAEDDEPEDDDAPAAPKSAVDRTKVRELVKAKNYKELFKLLDIEPEDMGLDPKAWSAWRAANAREWKKLKGHEQGAMQRLGAWDQQLKANHAQLQQHHADLTRREERVSRYEQAEAAYEKDGDPKHLVALIEGITKRPYDEAQRDILHKNRRTPGERRLQEELATYKAELAALKSAVEKPPAPPPVDPEAAMANDIKIITARVYAAVKDGQLHADTAKVPHFAKRVYTVLKKTMGPMGLTQTPEEAARVVLRAERKRIAAHPLAKTPAPAAAPAKGKKSTPPLRGESRSPGTSMRSPTESNDDIINDILRKKNTNTRLGNS